MVVDRFTTDDWNVFDGTDREYSIDSHDPPFILSVDTLKIFLKSTTPQSVHSYQRRYQNVRKNVVKQYPLWY